MIDISGLDKGALLAALYNNARMQGNGLRIPFSTTLTAEHGREVLDRSGMSFDYLDGRVLKIELGGDELDAVWYDRDNGEGKAQRVIDQLRKDGSVTEIV